MSDMFGQFLGKTSLEDLNAGSVFEAFLDAEVKIKSTITRTKLIIVLARLDSRFKKYLPRDP